MFHVFFCFLLLLANAHGQRSFAADAQTGKTGVEPKTAPTVTTNSLSEQAMSLRKAADEAKAAYLKMVDAKDPVDADKEKAWAAYSSTADRDLPKILQLIRQEPKAAWAFDMLEWMIMEPRNCYQPYGHDAVELLRTHHASNPKVAKACSVLGYYWLNQPATYGFLREVTEQNPDSTTLGQAHLALARSIKYLAESNQYTNQNARQEIELLLEKVIQIYGEQPDLRPVGLKKPGLTLKDDAARELFEIRHLSIGCQAPEIEGEDGQGNKMKLSEQRGKVTVLVFWASWCGPCMAMVPHERELVKRMQGKPFALIGVNGDGEKAEMLKVMEKEGMTWSSFWNGPEGPSGPISKAWNVQSWPTIYVLDEQGIIRYKDVQGRFLDEAVEKLLRKLSDKQK